MSWHSFSYSTWPARGGVPQLALILPGVALFVLGAKLGLGFVLLGWLLGMTAILRGFVGWRRALWSEVRVTLEPSEVVVSVGQDSFRIPKSRRVRFAPRLFYSGHELRWPYVPWPWGESRLVLGKVSAEQRRTLEVWRAQPDSPPLERESEAEPATSIEVHSTSEHKTCPLCHDDVLARRIKQGACSGCGALYHSACWEEFGGCALPACRSLEGARGANPLRLLVRRASA